MWQSILVLVLLLFSTVNYADKTHNLREVEQLAYEYASEQAHSHYDHPSIIVQSLDNRLRLHPCTSKLKVFSKSAETKLGKRTIGVRCLAPVEWSVFVPVEVKVLKTVIVTNRPLPVNHLLTSADIKTVVMDISKLRHGYMTDENLVLGKQLRYSVANGKALTPRILKAQKVVERGEQVVLVARSAGMEVKMNGTAMADAKLGDTIKAMNNSSERVIEGIVEAPGIILVRM